LSLVFIGFRLFNSDNLKALSFPIDGDVFGNKRKIKGSRTDFSGLIVEKRV